MRESHSTIARPWWLGVCRIWVCSTRWTLHIENRKVMLKYVIKDEVTLERLCSRRCSPTEITRRYLHLKTFINSYFWYRHIESQRITTLYTKTGMNMKKEGLRKGKMKCRKDTVKKLTNLKWTTKWRRVTKKKISIIMGTRLTTKNSPWCRRR